LLGLVEALGLDMTNVPRMASAFGAGVARHGEICGALIGAAIALGLAFGREDPKDVVTRNALYARMDALMSAFEAEYGTVRCIELTGCDMTTPEGLAKSRELDLHGSVCPKFIEFTARETARLMET